MPVQFDDNSEIMNVLIGILSDVNAAGVVDYDFVEDLYGFKQCSR